jgi:hypothetical protein
MRPVSAEQMSIAARTVYATVLLISPATVLGGLPHRHVDRLALAFARTLAVRHLAEAVLLERHRTRGWLVAGAAVDGAHAASMLVVAARRPRRRPLALANAAVATTFFAVGVHEAHRA